VPALPPAAWAIGAGPGSAAAGEAATAPATTANAMADLSADVGSMGATLSGVRRDPGHP